MGKIVSINEAINASKKIKKDGKRIVVAGGCFDILHIGHIAFLKNARKEGDYLFILLEDDQSVKNKRGKGRPINNQKDRAEILSNLVFADFVVMLEEMTTNNDYDTLMAEISPDIFATTKDDTGVKHKERQAEKNGGTVKFVTKRIKNVSSSKFSRLLGI
jgi:rfaE bifunctional protein nucleotidyltransferase chain/domain